MPQSLPKLTARYQPQAWQGDNAINIDGKKDFDAAPIIIAMSAADFQRTAAEVRRSSGRDMDNLAYRTDVRGDHTGPFRVDIDQEDFEKWLGKAGFDAAALAEVDNSVMEKMRADYGVAAYVRAGEEVIAASVMKDWRVAEKSDDELSEAQRWPWTVQVSKTSMNGLVVEFGSFDGLKHEVAFEIDRGNLKIIPYRGQRDHDDVEAIIVLTKEGIHVTGNGQAGRKTDTEFVFDHDGGRVVGHEPAPSYVDEPSPKP
jgi:hypothetical protein